MSDLTATFHVQFRRSGNGLVAQKLTQSRSRVPRGSGAISVQFRVTLPGWVFDPLDLVAEAIVPAEHAVPVIRLESVGPVFDASDTSEEAER